MQNAALNARLQNATSLRQLRDLLNATSREEIELDANILTGLPTFGGAEPRDTRGIYSWDATSLLITEQGRGFVIVPREA
jgi:hypothetical protein